MPTGYQIDEQDAMYFLTFQVVNWVDVFTRRDYKEIIINSLKYCQQNKDLKIYAFVIMSNHIHLIIQSGTNKLSQTIKEFKSFTAREILTNIKTNNESRKHWMLSLFKEAVQRHQRNKNFQFWTHENHAEIIYSNSFFKQKMNYIHDNPVRAGIVTYPEDYFYSSAAIYSGKSNLLKIEYLEVGVEGHRTTRRIK